MGLIIFLLILCLPGAEIWVIGRVAGILGFWDTCFLLIFSAMFGVYLAKHQGRAVLAKVQQCMAEGRTPTNEMIDGLLIFLGGILFVIPGFITDAIGLLLIFPPTRWCIRWLIAKKAATGFAGRQASGFATSFQFGAKPSPAPKTPVREVPRPRGPVQDAEIVE